MLENRKCLLSFAADNLNAETSAARPTGISTHSGD